MKFLMRLYEDGAPDAVPEPASPDHEVEARALRQVKQVLDARDRHRPPESTMDAIAAAAGASTARSASRPRDREAVRSRRRIALPIGVAGGGLLVAALLLVLVDPNTAPVSEDLAMEPRLERPAPGEPASRQDDHATSRHENAPRSGAVVTGPGAIASRPGEVVLRRDDLATLYDEAAPELHETGRRRGAADDPVRMPLVASARQPFADGAPAGVGVAKPHVPADLTWDDSEDVREVYRELMQLELISPSGGSWRPVVADPLATPVGVSPSYRLTRLE